MSTKKTIVDTSDFRFTICDYYDLLRSYFDYKAYGHLNFKIETISASDQNSDMPFLRNEFLKIFEFYDNVIFKDENNL